MSCLHTNIGHAVVSQCFAKPLYHLHQTLLKCLFIEAYLDD
jgi:hypothetical protein